MSGLDVKVSALDEVIRLAAVAANHHADGVARALAAYLASGGLPLELQALRAELVALAAGFEQCAHDGSTLERRREAARDAIMAWDSALAQSSERRTRGRMGANIRTVRLCKTEFLEPSDRPQLDARVRARHVTTSRSVIVSWVDNLDEVENHARAAEKVLGRYPEFRASIDGGGYMMGCEPDDGSVSK